LKFGITTGLSTEEVADLFQHADAILETTDQYYHNIDDVQREIKVAYNGSRQRDVDAISKVDETIITCSIIPMVCHRVFKGVVIKGEYNIG
jgi:hypothetical protein